MVDWVGYSWLLDTYAVVPVQPMRRKSMIGPKRESRSIDGFAVEIYTPNYRPEPSFDAHMTFALKNEGVYPEILARLFKVLPETEMLGWINRERAGQYARRAGFLWEWFNQRELPGLSPLQSGNYVDAVDSDIQLAALVAVNNQRWRVRDNLPGTPAFCPLVLRTDAVKAAETYSCKQQLELLNVEFGADVLLRSAVWLTIKESRSSFIIEREERKLNDIQRFAAAMERNCGVVPNPLSEDALASLQREIIGTRTTLQHFGFRKSPVFVGSVAHYENIVHYIAPHWDALPGMLAGLESFLVKTKGRSSLVRAAVAAFAFVYIHPLADGNGRIHRFLINDILRRDGEVPSPYILPVSATITHSPVERARYDQVLDVFSKPLMNRISSACEFGQRQTYPDGIESDFNFLGYDESSPAWRYPDLTSQVEYLADIIDKTLREEMANEARKMRDWDRARSGVKQVIEGPDTDIDWIIRAIRDNSGVVSSNLRKRFPILDDLEIAQDVAAAVNSVFEVKGLR